MNRLIVFCLFMFLYLIRPCFASEVAAQIKTLPDNTMEVLFYQGEKEVARWHYDQDGNIAEKSGTVPDGIVETYVNGLLVTRAHFRDGELNGLSRDYYLNGKLRSQSPYKNGKLNGKLIVYYENGSRHYIRNYRDGVAYGIMKEYWPGGKLKGRVTFDEGKAKIIEKYNSAGKVINKNILEEGKALSPLETQ